MSGQSYSCCGGKDCSGTEPAGGMNRRDFIKTATATGAGLAALFEVPAAHAADSAAEFAAWNNTLLEQGERRVYRGEELAHIAMPLGGIGAGQVYLRGDGTLNPWQILNNFNFQANTTGSFFAVRAKPDNGTAVAKLLQLPSIDEARGVSALEFEGEYPFGWIRYLDDELPLAVSLEAFSPFIPLNTKDSGLPAVVLTLKARNISDRPVDASLLASIPNLVGWNGYARLEDGPRHTEFGGNVNTVERLEKAEVIRCSMAPGTNHRLEQTARLYTNDADVAFQMRHCENLNVYYGRPAPIAQEPQPRDVYWASDINGRLSTDELNALLDRAHAGATLVITADEFSLVHAALRKNQAKSDIIVFENWESGSYGKWKIEGDCFGAAPVSGTLPGQQPVGGMQGGYYVNTYVGGDGTTGRAVSPEFTIEKRFIHFRIGGGNHPDETCLNLIVDGKVVHTSTGDNTEQLKPQRWDVSAFVGKKAVIEIVDTHTGGWGHILVDEIAFSNSPRIDLTLDAVTAQRIREALPFLYRSSKAFDGEPLELDSQSPALKTVTSLRTPVSPSWKASGFRVKKGSQVILRTRKKTPLIVAGPYGKGTVVVCNGAPERWFRGPDSKAIIGNTIALTSGNTYAPFTGMAPQWQLAGSMALGVVNAPDIVVSARAQWDDFAGLWRDFAEHGELKPGPDGPSSYGSTWNAAMNARISLSPGSEKSVSFVLAWDFPNRLRDETYGWGPPRYQYDHYLGNQYNNWFHDAVEVADYVTVHLDRLTDETRLFHTTFYNSTLPRYFLDAVTANASIIRSPIYVWLEDGTVGGFEGADRCCPMNCTHVYNYAMSMAYLFPSLERNVRETDLLVQMHPSEHYIPHRTVLPLSLPRLGKVIGGPEHPALDGELGTILKTYREWRMDGDRAWLAKLWERARALMLYIMREHDPNGEGVIRGEQPNTYDTHLYGSNTFIGTLYLAALRAAEEMALVMHDKESARAFRDRFEKGFKGYDKTCWNGEYYLNAYDAPDANEQTYNQGNCYGPGCHSDQLLGQWWAHVLGLGHVLPRDRVRQALQAIYRYNWRADLTQHKHAQRVFATGNEKGLLCASWPHGGRPERPILYCDEVWTGIEYHVAAAMLYEGMVTEAMQIVRGARDRYTGRQRNPWSEIECGQHYARAMSSYSLLIAAAGLEYDANSARLALSPRIGPDNFKVFFTTGSGWGSVAQQRDNRSQRNRIEVRYGEVNVQTLAVALPAAKSFDNLRLSLIHKRANIKTSARIAERNCVVRLESGLRLRANEDLRLEIAWV
ncbi:MAG: hypothetical protein AMXMBFR4_04870 [Candidatus Hydrogenedentota bacterium]